MALNTYPQAANPGPWRSAVDKAVDMGLDAVILATPASCVRRRLAPADAAAPVGAGLGHQPRGHQLLPQQFGVVRAVLPRVLSMEQVRQVIERTPVEIEVFGFGSLCVMVEAAAPCRRT